MDTGIDEIVKLYAILIARAQGKLPFYNVDMAVKQARLQYVYDPISDHADNANQLAGMLAGYLFIVHEYSFDAAKEVSDIYMLAAGNIQYTDDSIALEREINRLGGMMFRQPDPEILINFYNSDEHTLSRAEQLAAILPSIQLDVDFQFGIEHFIISCLPLEPINLLKSDQYPSITTLTQSGKWAHRFTDVMSDDPVIAAIRHYLLNPENTNVPQTDAYEFVGHLLHRMPQDRLAQVISLPGIDDTQIRDIMLSDVDEALDAARTTFTNQNPDNEYNLAECYLSGAACAHLIRIHAYEPEDAVNDVMTDLVRLRTEKYPSLLFVPAPENNLFELPQGTRSFLARFAPVASAATIVALKDSVLVSKSSQNAFCLGMYAYAKQMAM